MLNNLNICAGQVKPEAYAGADAIALLLCKECVAALGKLQLPQAVTEAVEAYTKKYNDIFSPGTLRTLTIFGEAGMQQVIIAGCGEGKECKPNNFRKACGNLSRELAKLKLAKAVVAAPIVMNETRAHYLQAMVEGLYLGAYTFTEYQKQDTVPEACEIALLSAIPGAEAVVKQGEIIASAVSYARDLVNRPGNAVYPEVMVQEAAKVATALNLDIEVLDTKAMAEKKMEAILAVGKGSVREPYLVTLKYEGKPGAPLLAYVGKGITFDSGGISIKPDDNMGEMKDDMTGSACVLGAIKAIAELQLPVNILAVLCLAENMPGGKAQRPGDIVRAANGKTIEVVSTDAEGRMVLADGVWYACQKGAAKVVDIATLTGAVIVALGTETSGIVSNDDALAQTIVEAGKQTGESWHQLPALPECKEAIKSDVADLLNSAGRSGGCITGGLFIGEFVAEGTPWAHLDIGGTSTATKTSGHKVKGGTAFGTMTLIKLAGKL